MDPKIWHASLAGVVVAAGALIQDQGGRVLCVKPNYRDYWTLPGGMCELGEAPHRACAREVAEELGLALSVGGLLVVDWQPALPEYGPGARPSMYFIFDGGVVEPGQDIVLQQDELDAYKFAAPIELGDLLAPAGLRRTLAALTARTGKGRAGAATYLPHEPAEQGDG